MKSHMRRGEAGFSFVELLVTIIIAGIAFAAIVPVFVQAEKGTSADNVRMLASNIAQDRIEKVRQLDYDVLTLANLNSGSFYFGQFGTTWTQATASGNRAFTVAYEVVEDTAKATKTVTVRVDWVGPPTPHKTVVMSTVSYRQSVGPTITWTFSPSNDPVPAGTLRIIATVNAEDVDAMRPYTIGASTLQGRVVFMIERVGGTAFPLVTKKYDTSDATTHTQYTYDWPVPGGDGSLDGNYSIRAVAYTTGGIAGATLSTIRCVETGPPAAVTNLVVTPGNGGATVSWNASVSGDVDHYEVFRTNSSGTTVQVAGAPGWRETGLTDRGSDPVAGLPTGTYTYKVYTVDLAGNRTVATAAPVEVLNSGGMAPAAATGLTGYVSGPSAVLSWTASTSNYVTEYVVYKNGVQLTALPRTATSYTTNQGWGSTAKYQVKASSFTVEAGWAALSATMGEGCASVSYGGATWLQATTPSQFFTLSITNNVKLSGKFIALTSLKLEKLVSGSWVVCNTPTGLSEFAPVAASAISTWTGLTPQLTYRWTWVYPNSKGVPVTGSTTQYISGTPAAQTGTAQ